MNDDGPQMTPGAAAPASQPAEGDPPGLRAQFGATVEAGRRLLRAHIDLARTEIGEIVGEVRRIVALAGLALGAVLAVGLLVSVGLPLFLGEWLFGSIGWGILHGSFVLLDVAAIALLLALDVKGKRLATSLLTAVVVGTVVGVVLGLDLTHRGWTALADTVLPAYDPNNRAVVLALAVSAAVLGLLGFLSGLRAGARGAFGRLFGLAIAGVLLGLLTVVSLPSTVGAALGVLVGLITWPVLAARDLMRTGVDGDAIMRRFMPEQTIGLTKETIEWVRARTPLAPKS